MQLVSLWISGYKNLNNANIRFSDGNVLTAVIGNNGTGKSNLIEVLLEIFIGLYYGDDPSFDFRLSYKVHGKYVEVEKSSSSMCVIKVDGITWGLNRFRKMAQQPTLRPPFPALVFGYYSGTCKRLEKQFNRYRRTYSAKLRSQSIDLEKSFVFSTIEHAKFVLLALLASQEFELLNDISNLSIKRLSITLQPPVHFNPKEDDPKFWGTSGVVSEFLADLDNAASDSFSSTQSKSEEELSIELSRTYILNQDGLEKVGRSSNTARGANVFNMLQALQMKKMLVKVEYSMNHLDGLNEFTFEDLSEEEKQLISVIGALALSNKNESLVLLDEPDTHLNPAWTWKYSSLLKTAANISPSNSSTILVTTHNPILISGLLKEQVLIAHNEDGQLTYTNPHRDPRGQGVANVLTSEFFGLPSSLDEHTQKLIDRRLVLAYKNVRLTDLESVELGDINKKLDSLGLSISFRDPEYKYFEEEKYGAGST